MRGMLVLLIALPDVRRPVVESTTPDSLLEGGSFAGSSSAAAVPELESPDPGTDWPVQLVDYFAWEYEAATSR